MSILQEKITSFLDNHGTKKLRQETGIGCKAIDSIKKGYRNKKYTKQTLDTLYDFFKIKKDEFYEQNLKKWIKSDESVLGNLLRKKREQVGLSKKEVAKIIKGTERHLSRIEAGDMTPHFNSYYLREILKVYKFSEEDSNQIRWYVASLHDIIELNRNI